MAQPTVFISYSHKDEIEKDALLSHLGVLQHAGMIDVWSDDRIGAGSDWQADISQWMVKAKVAILLISANFLTSDFILNEEVPKLLNRREQEGLTVYPIIAKHCAWTKVKWLAKMNVRPKNGNPVWREGGHHADEELSKIAEEVARIIEQAGPVSEMGNDVSRAQHAVSSTPQPSPPSTRPKKTTLDNIQNAPKNKINWTMVGAIATIIAVVIALVGVVFGEGWVGSDDYITPSPTQPIVTISSSVDLLIKVFDKSTNKPVGQVNVQLISQDSANSQSKSTDSDGEVVFVNAIDKLEKRIRVLVVDERYQLYDNTTTINRNNPIFDVFLVPE